MGQMSGRHEAMEGQQFEPVGVGLAGQQLLGHLSHVFKTAAAHEQTMAIAEHRHESQLDRAGRAARCHFFL